MPVEAPTPAVADNPPAAAAPTPAATAPEPAPAPTPAAAVPTPAAAAPTPAAPAGAQTPAQLLTAARAFHGPLAGRIAAYNAYFDAAPTDDRTMATLAMSLAEGHPAEAEAVAARTVAANPANGQGWLVLAYSRGQLHNRAGSLEARTRCIALGGRWASECRGL